MYRLVSQMELAVRLPWMQRGDVSELDQELTIGGTRTGNEKGVEKIGGGRIGGGGRWCAAEEKYLGGVLSMTYVM